MKSYSRVSTEAGRFDSQAKILEQWSFQQFGKSRQN